MLLIFKSVIFDAACPEGTRGIENHTFENPPEADLLYWKSAYAPQPSAPHAPAGVI